MAQKKPGTVELPYHKLIRLIAKETGTEVSDQEHIALIIGLFSTLSKDSETDEEKVRLDHGSDVIKSKSEVAHYMEKVWQTNAKVKINYSALKDIFTDLPEQQELTLHFKDPKHLSYDELKNVIRESENMLSKETRKGVSKLLNAIIILETLLEFIDSYQEKVASLIYDNSYDNIVDLLIDIFTTEWGKEFITILEKDKNITIDDLVK